MKQIIKKHYVFILLLFFILFIVWRLLRPLNIFIVDDRFAWPVDTSQAPVLLADLSATQCAECHPDFYQEWKTSIHSQAWTDPYFQADWQFDGLQHNCRLCHTPLDRQQPEKVLAYRDSDKWDPVLVDNPGFDENLQHEGVTCAACHYRDGKIVGVLGTTNAPHAVQKIADPNQICVRCHIVEGERWDTFFRYPPCGTVAEIRRTQQTDLQARHDDFVSTMKLLPEKAVEGISSLITTGSSGEASALDYPSLACVQCHMPLLERPLVAAGERRLTRQHLWRGGHDPAMVKQALSFDFAEYKPADSETGSNRIFRLMITNIGAQHFVPTGTPDRYLSVQLRLLDAQDKVIDEKNYRIRRTVMWRPFIIDLWDTRLRRWLPEHYELSVNNTENAVKVEALVKYHLLDESRRQRINYHNKTAINYEIFRGKISLSDESEEQQSGDSL